jgi:hypothetical protein
MVCGTSPAVAAVVRVERRQVHLVDSIEDEEREVFSSSQSLIDGGSR